jgi:hypothetical protein
MGGQKASNEPRPLLSAEHFSQYRKAWQKKALDIVVNHACVYPHAIGLDTCRARI